MELNAVLHPGWTKESLLHLFNVKLETVTSPTPRSQGTSRCDFYDPCCTDCGQRIHYCSSVRVEPHWRHEIERLKKGMIPDSPSTASLEISDDVTEPLTGLAPLLQESTIPYNNLSYEEWSRYLEESSDEGDPHLYPKMVSLQAQCMYKQGENVCIGCWLRYVRTGTRPSRHDDDLKDEFSPFLIHS